MSAQAAMISLREARAVAFVQTRATVDSSMRAHWQLQLRLIDRAIADLGRDDQPSPRRDAQTDGAAL